MSYIGTPPRKQLGGKVLLSKQIAVAGTSSITFDSGIDDTYDVYEFHCIGIHPSGASLPNFGFQVDTGTNTNFNQPITSSYYAAASNYTADGAGNWADLYYSTGEDSHNGTADQKIAHGAGDEADDSSAVIVKMYGLSSSIYVKQFNSINQMNHHNDSSYTLNSYADGYINTTTPINKVRFQFDAGDIDAGVIKMYGISFGTPLQTDSKRIVWSRATDAPSTDYGLKFGTKSAGASLRGGGTTTDEWDGSSWSTGGSSAVDRGSGGSGGTQTAGVVYAGYHDSDESVTTEEYNGTSWSSGNDMAVGASGVSGSGPTQTWQICTGGSQYNPTVRDISSTQTYNGTNWANESVASDGRATGGMTGVEDDVLFHHGALDSPGSQNTATYWNGSSWATKATAPNIGRYIGNFGSSTRAYRVGGWDQDALGAPAYYYIVGYPCESWTDDVWSNENVLPFTGSPSGGLTGTSGDGWVAAINDKPDGTYSGTNYAYHFEASEL